MSATEAADLRENIIEALQTVWKQTDDLITRTNRQKADAWIWRSIDADDTAFLAESILAAGMRIPLAALAVRKIAESWGWYRAGAILLPHFVETWNFYAEHGGFAIGGKR